MLGIGSPKERLKEKLTEHTKEGSDKEAPPLSEIMKRQDEEYNATDTYQREQTAGFARCCFDKSTPEIDKLK